MNPIIDVENLNFSYRTMPGHAVPVLHDLSFKINSGEFVAIQGSSGSGKSTLLYLLGCLCPVQQGRVLIGGIDISKLTDDELALFRNENLGFVFQQFHLLPKANVLENILLSARYPIEKPKDIEVFTKKAIDLATKLGLEDRLYHGPQELSGGQQQRVAIARALLNGASIIFADEPTGNLDSKSAALVMEELKALNKEGKTIIIITHETNIAAQAHRTILIHDGRVVSTGASKVVSTDVSNSVTTGVSTSSKNTSSISPITRPHLEPCNPISSYLSLLPFAAANIFRNKARSILTMIGISIGVSSVLAMITLGQFAKDKILSSYAELGINTLSFRGYRNWNQKAIDNVGLTFSSFSWEKDLLPIKDIFPEVLKISPMLYNWSARLSFGGKIVEDDARTVGLNEEAFSIIKRKLKRGNSLSLLNVLNHEPACVIGSEVVVKLFRNVDPLGEILQISSDNQSYGCRIIGTLQSLETRSEWRNPNLEVYVPYTYFQNIAGNWWQTRIQDVLMQVRDGEDIEKVGKSIKFFFERKYGKSGRFNVDADSILIGQMNQFLNIFSIFLTSIALISLGVGGIGIANMMLVSVSERYREIGLRKALGATNVSIRQQFLLEAILLCGIAGMIGLFFGFIGYEAIIWAGSKLTPKLSFEWVINFKALLFASISILAVGIMSGFIPALRAEKLAPIEALRSE